MDLTSTIKMLRKERAKLNELIRELEGQQTAAALKSVKKRRGRKCMGVEERRQVAKRMRRHWAERREPSSDHPS